MTEQTWNQRVAELKNALDAGQITKQQHDLLIDDLYNSLEGDAQAACEQAVLDEMVDGESDTFDSLIDG